MRSARLHMAGSTLVVMALVAVAVGPQLAAAQSTGQFFASVSTPAGEPVTGLTADDFQVTEDGVAMTVLSVDPGTTPMKVAVLIDNSEAIAETNGLSSLRSAATAFLDALPAQHAVALLSIAGGVQLLMDFTTDRPALRDEAGGLGNGRGGTKFIEGVMETWDRRFGERDAWPVIVVVSTDGAESSRHVNPDQFNAFTAELAARGVMVHTVLLHARGGNQQTQVSMNLSQTTGGMHRIVNTPTALVDALRELATRMGAHFDAMSPRYRLLYERPGDTAGGQMGASLLGPPYRLRLFADRRMPQP